MSTGLDTSVILRLLVGRPEEQAQKARQAVQLAALSGPVYLCDLVLAEAYHALVYHYEIPKPKTQSLLQRMLTSGVFTCSPRDMVAGIGQTGGCGLVDRLIMARYHSLDATTLTFDRKMASAGAQLVG